MRRIATSSRLAGVPLVMLAGLLAVWVPGIHAEQQRVREDQAGGQRPTARVMSADMAVRHQRLGADGRPAGSSSEVILRLARELRNGRWVTRMQVRQAPEALVRFPDGVRRLANPFAAVHVEVDEDAERVWLIGADGNRRPVVSPEVARLLGGEKTPEGRPSAPPTRGRVAHRLFAEAGFEGERRDELVRRFGPSRGRVRGLDRYVHEDQEGLVEVLVDPVAVLPVELRSDGPTGMRTQTRVSYESRPGAGYVRRLLRSEHRLGSVPGAALTEVELTNVVVGGAVQP